jgi:hypothetical protein
MNLENETKKPTKRGRKPKGLGDVVESITEATGIKAAVEWFSEATGVDCGCDARKAKLNKLFPIHNPECLTKAEYDFIGTILGKGQLEHSELDMVAKIHARTFRHKYAMPCTCSPKIWNKWIGNLKDLYEAYDQQGA